MPEENTEREARGVSRKADGKTRGGVGHTALPTTGKTGGRPF